MDLCVPNLDSETVISIAGTARIVGQQKCPYNTEIFSSTLMRNYLMGNLKPDKDGHCNIIFFLSNVATPKPEMAHS